jgi:hypothetical protein
MNCTICGKPVKLEPSAVRRALVYGGTPASYERMFTEHTDCALAKRDQETRELMRRTQQPSDHWVRLEEG